MKSIKITVTGSDACVTEKPVLTSGTVGLPVEFTFDEAWNGLDKTAVFRAGSRCYPVSCVQAAATVPWEVLEKPGVGLYIGVLGADHGGIVKIPTVWALVDTIAPGTGIPDTVPKEPTPQVYDQILSAANQAVDVANSVREDADNGVFNGDPGKPGVTDYATTESAGIVRIGAGLKMVSGTRLQIEPASKGSITQKSNTANPIVPSNLDYAVREALTIPKNVVWTDEQKAAARDTLGAISKSDMEEYVEETILGGAW